MKKPPESYLNARRPPIREAMSLEGGTFNEAMESLGDVVAEVPSWAIADLIITAVNAHRK